MKTLCLSIIISLLWISSLENSLAQIPKAPKNLEFFEGYGFRFSTTQYGSFYWQNVPNATGYRIDVANDSLFTDILPGLHNIPIIRHIIEGYSFPPRWIPGTTTATIFGLSHSSLYYCRIRAENSAGTSENSTTLTIKTAPVNCIVIEPIGVSDSSISIRWRDAKKFRYRDDIATNSLCPASSTNATFSVRYEPFFQDSFCLETIGAFVPSFTNTANTLSVQGSSITLKNLNANTRYAIALSLPPNGTGKVCNITTLPRQFSQYGRIISFYEGPLAHRSPRDTSAYYSRNDTNTTLEKALSLVEQVRSMGIAIDTLWFHASVARPLTGRVFVPSPDGDFKLYPAVCGFTIKLRQKDDRLAALGFTNRVGFWQYADNLMFYRYIFSGTTSVSMPFALNTPIAIAPNPTSDQTTIYYTLPNPSTVTIEVYNLLGHRLYDNILGYQNAGTHTTSLDLHHLSNGMYRIHLRMSNGTAPAQIATQAITILK
jgi:hypothetical protein